MKISIGRMSLNGTLPYTYQAVSKPTPVHNEIKQETHLPSRLVQPQVVSELVLADSAGRVDLVPEHEEGHLREILDGEERVELGLGLGEALVVSAVDEEDDSVDFGEVVAPETTRCGVVLGGENGGRLGSGVHVHVSARFMDSKVEETHPERVHQGRRS